MDISHDQARQRFEIDMDDHRGVLDYTLSEDENVIAFRHTQVDDALEGEGVGSALVRHGLAYARNNGLQVDPQCPFVRSYIEHHADEYGDLVPTRFWDTDG